jgi:hypothetical protein
MSTTRIPSAYALLTLRRRRSINKKKLKKKEKKLKGILRFLIKRKNKRH